MLMDMEEVWIRMEGIGIERLELTIITVPVQEAQRTHRDHKVHSCK